MDRTRIEEMVAGGASIATMAREVGVSSATVRNWLDRYGLETRRAARLRQTRGHRAAGRQFLDLECSRHGLTGHKLQTPGGYKCLRCWSEAVSARRRRIKETLVAEAGGCCRLCGYDRSLAALQFHHLDRSAKAFHLSFRGIPRAIERAREEASKCVLLCANCHAEVEAGAADLPLPVRPRATHHIPG